MSEATTIAIVQNLSGIITAFAACIAALSGLLAWIQGRRNGAKADTAVGVALENREVTEKIHIAVNSNMEAAKAEIAGLKEEVSGLHKLVSKMMDDNPSVLTVSEAAKATADAAIDTLKAATSEHPK